MATAAPTTPAQSTSPSGTYAAIIDAYARAHDRAVTARLVAYKVAEGVYDVPSTSKAGKTYRVTFVGPHWFQWTCECAGANHPACVHRAVAIYCKRHKLAAVRPAARFQCANCGTEPVRVRGDWCGGCVALKHAAPVLARPEGYLADEIASDRPHMLPRRLQVIR